jgi:hypothetical protein
VQARAAHYHRRQIQVAFRSTFERHCLRRIRIS